jgi:hypothetical protein
VGSAFCSEAVDRSEIEPATSSVQSVDRAALRPASAPYWSFSAFGPAGGGVLLAPWTDFQRMAFSCP